MKTNKEQILHRTKNIFKFYSEGSLAGERFNDHIFTDTIYKCTAKSYSTREHDGKYTGVVNVDNIFIITKCDEDKEFLFGYIKTKRNLDDFYLWLIGSSYVDLLSSLRDYKIDVNFSKLSSEPVIIKYS